MDRLLENSSMDIDKKLIACENTFHILLSSDNCPLKKDEDVDKRLSQSLKNFKHSGMEQTAFTWLINQLDQEIKPPTSMYDNDSFMLEMKERGKLWSCLIKICTLYPAISERTFLNTKLQPCEFIVKAMAEGIDINSSMDTSSKIFQWITRFVLHSEIISCALYRQPLSYNQAIAKLISVSQKDSTFMDSNMSLDLKFILEHYKKFLKQIHKNVTEGGCLDVDSIEGNFLEVILPVLIDEDENKIAQEAELYKAVTEVLNSILFKRERIISDWKDFLDSLRVADRKPNPQTDHIEKLLYFLQHNNKENNRVLKLLPILFNAILLTGSKMNERQEGMNIIKFTHKEIVLFFMMCCYILKIGPLTSSLSSQIILDSSLAACKITGLIDEKCNQEERLFVFGNLVKFLSNFSSPSALVSVEFNTNEDDNLENSIQFITWLKLCLKDLLETKIHDGNVEKLWKNTYSSITVITNMMKLDSRIVEPLIGSILGNVLFKKLSQSPNNNESEIVLRSFENTEALTSQIAKALFLKELFLTYSKLRQIPKLIAKFFLCLQIKDDTVGESQFSRDTYPFSSSDVLDAKDLIICGSYFSKLPNAQLIEVFKTFLYHLESIEASVVNDSLLSQKDLKSEYYVAVLNLSNQLIPCFLENSTMSDHLVPMSIKEKFIQLMIKMHKAIESKFGLHIGLVKSVEVSLSQLASLMITYDSFEGSSELKIGLQTIISDAEQFEDKTNKLISTGKRKLTSVTQKESKRKKKSSDNYESDKHNNDLLFLQNDLLEKVDTFTEEDYYKTAKLIWTCVSHEDLFPGSSEYSWISSFITENLNLQNAIVRVSMETFAPYFEENSSVSTNFKAAFQYLYNHQTETTGAKNNLSIKEISEQTDKNVNQNILLAAQTFGNYSMKEIQNKFKLQVSLKSKDVTSFRKIYGHLLPLELTQGSTESTTSLFLCLLLVLASTSKNIEFLKYVVASLLRCWDTTYRTTNLLRYIPFGKLLRLVCRFEITSFSDPYSESNSKLFGKVSHDRIPLTMQLSKIGVSLQSNSDNANPLLNLNDGTIKELCNSVSSFLPSQNEKEAKCMDYDMIVSDTLCSGALMKSIVAFVAVSGQNSKPSNSKTLQDEKNKNILYFTILGETFLSCLKHMNLNHKDFGDRLRKSSNNALIAVDNCFDKMTVVISGVSACMALKPKIPSLNLTSIEPNMISLIQYALKSISSVVESIHRHDRNTSIVDVQQYFHFLKTTCKHIAISGNDGDSNENHILLIWQNFLSNNVIQLKSSDKSDGTVKLIEEYENELFETILSTFKNKSLFKDLVTALIDNLKSELKAEFNRMKFRRLMNIVANLATLSFEAETDKNYEVRQRALEKVIQILQVVY